jgi:hypothetical protein
MKRGPPFWRSPLPSDVDRGPHRMPSSPAPSLDECIQGAIRFGDTSGMPPKVDAGFLTKPAVSRSSRFASTLTRCALQHDRMTQRTLVIRKYPQERVLIKFFDPGLSTSCAPPVSTGPYATSEAHARLPDPKCERNRLRWKLLPVEAIGDPGTRGSFDGPRGYRS